MNELISRLPRAAAVLIAPMLAACSDPVFCTDDTPPAVEVTIRDLVTQDYLTVVPRGVVREGAFADSLVVWHGTVDPPQVLSMAAAFERSGVYAVHVEADEYEPWDTAGVAVSRNECHVITAQLTAALNPAP
jgi:hypothetical protein